MVSLTYLNIDTPVHRLSPLSKLYLLFCLLVVILETFNLVVLLSVVAYSLGFWIIGRISPREFKSFLSLVLGVCVFFVIANGLFYYEGVTSLFTVTLWGRIYSFTVEGVVFGVAVACKIAASITAFPVLTMTTPISRLMAALARIRVP